MAQPQPLDRVVIRFAGDSGDGMQLTGDRFTAEAAGLGNDIATLPNFPAEIRAPQGTLPGVSSFQLHFADFDIVTPGGHAYGETTESFEFRYEVAPAPMKPGRYRQVSGNMATAYGLMAGAHKADMQLFLGSYPITPASDILHELSKRKDIGVVTFQAEDEIAGVAAALGASYGGALGVTSTSGPGILLKSETISLGVMTEIPLVIVNVQRAGPSTGMPTKTEQADLLQAIHGRNGEAPVPVIAAK